ncbi:hypothetical protein QL285_034763 [Trifolium repens]|nr:hypothetical protein QL285_034763 [Trifolium repens]
MLKNGIFDGFEFKTEAEFSLLCALAGASIHVLEIPEIHELAMASRSELAGESQIMLLYLDHRWRKFLGGIDRAYLLPT